MKLIIAFAVLALALGAQSSIIPLSVWPPALSYTAVHGPAIAIAPSPIGSVAIHVAGPVPAVVAAAPAPAVVVAAPVQGTYVAQTRGAVHVAPLEGHANSASSINLQPAPGTV